ncbi:MAG TPA: hypothetical protein VF987_01190 [Rhodospirillales bacterium]|jgi:hypothetical protein
MRIVKASALALALTVSLGLGSALAADAPYKTHGWFHHSGTHPICDALRALFTHGHHKKVVSVAY